MLEVKATKNKSHVSKFFNSKPMKPAKKAKKAKKDEKKAVKKGKKSWD